jgi:hypothetical protein
VEASIDEVEGELGAAVSYARAWAACSLELTGSVGEDGVAMRITPGVFWRGLEPLQVGVAVPVELGGDAMSWGIATIASYELKILPE